MLCLCFCLCWSLLFSLVFSLVLSPVLALGPTQQQQITKKIVGFFLVLGVVNWMKIDLF
jgi:hypothetical protein